uniref:BRCT domain-containing protein n=1 Tax=Globisporangium ultimum (strain ATCC 200006 / CBS 805.95 / DAOM BR144) TaxID=431595 RepID=K3WTI6_GLOUD
MSEKLFDGLWICTTGLEVHVKEQIRKIVLACGGTFDDDLALDSTTHLIADAVGSQKHRAAEAHNIHVATPKWVFDSFRAHTLLDIASYRLRILEGLVICTTGLASHSRDQVERMATIHGALYDPNLEVGHTSVLIAQRPGGAKYEASVSFNIPIVHISWLHACLENETLLDESEFSLEKVLRPSRLFSQLQEEINQVVTALPQLMKRYHEQHKQDDDWNPQDDDDDVEWMDLFDSCIFHLIGFPSNVEAQLQQLIRTSMGTIYYDMSTAHVTHVLVSPSLRDGHALASLEEQVSMAHAETHVHFVSAKWLLDSIKCLRLEPEEMYPVEIDADHEMPPTAPSVPSMYETALDASYEHIPDAIECAATIAAAAQDDGAPPAPDAPQDDADDIPQGNKPQSLFSGCAFLLLCRDPDDRLLIKPLIKQIHHQSQAQAFAVDFRDLAHLDTSQFTFLTHIVICDGVDVEPDVAMQIDQQFASLKDVDKHDNNDQKKRKRRRGVTFVSDLWVHCCLAAQVMLSHQAHELFSLTVHQTRSLFSHPLPLRCFTKVRASTSVYVGVDRVVVMELLKLAGAQATSKMSKRNSHLICLKPIGMKYEKAKEWGLKIVTARWLIQSIIQGTLLDEQADEFQVKDEDDGNGDADEAAADVNGGDQAGE